MSIICEGITCPDAPAGKPFQAAGRGDVFGFPFPDFRFCYLVTPGPGCDGNTAFGDNTAAH